MTANKPNILVIWGDDIGWQNVSAYGMGTMGYTTPNIDRIGQEGIRFTDHYAQPSCTAGRAAFITGQYPIRSGMTTVGQPGDPLGLQTESPSLAEVLKAEGYATGHFGKSHLGGRNEHLPTNHGFDEFFGNLYHLNVSEEDQQRDYEAFAKAYAGSLEEYEKMFGARGVIHSWATEADDPTEDPRFGRVGKQRIEDTGPLHQDRMHDIDANEVIPLATDFMKRAQSDGKPFFVWLNTSRMHLYTRLGDDWRYAAEKYTSEADLHGSGMLQHDHDIGVVLDFLEAQGLADNTIVWYSTDNGPEHSSWPHGATTPWRGEKMTAYEGGVRVVSMLRWPGVVDSGHVPYWTGQSQRSARNHVFHYYESKLMAIRMGPWKFHFSTKEDYYANVIPRTVPLVFNIRMDPFESYDDKDSYGHLMQKVSWLIGPMSKLMAEHVKSLVEYPPVQGGKSFDMSNVIEQFMRRGHD